MNRPSIEVKFLLDRLVHKFKGSMILRDLQEQLRGTCRSHAVTAEIFPEKSQQISQIHEIGFAKPLTSLVSPRLIHDFLLDGDSIFCHRGLSLFRVHTALLSEFLQGINAVLQLQLWQDRRGRNTLLARNKDLAKLKKGSDMQNSGFTVDNVLCNTKSKHDQTNLRCFQTDL